ncbi:hypothetical protein CDAR_278691 [Caerostris darwini]|uniref:Uncharacterized protein n=1 Tax=Caerostris darwini TaxID=1538125 RepID=A0AAV4WQ57_9ARAC|nr:hypothetical protein CDAR_278691 [Caerostris darwini]
MSARKNSGLQVGDKPNKIRRIPHKALMKRKSSRSGALGWIESPIDWLTLQDSIMQMKAVWTRGADTHSSCSRRPLSLSTRPLGQQTVCLGVPPSDDGNEKNHLFSFAQITTL